MAVEAHVCFDNPQQRHNQFQKNTLSTLIEKQRMEIDSYVNLQSERMKMAIREQSRLQLNSILGKVEAKAAILIGQKDEQILQGLKRRRYLEEVLRSAAMEREAWKRVAGEGEVMIAHLNMEIEQRREKAAMLLQQQMLNDVVEDAESCCEEQGRRGEKRRRKTTTMACGNCNGGGESSRVVLLPCRHVCCCKEYEASVNACPVCSTVKEGAIEALFS